jgi:glutamate/aspartate transport system substrate-binding protein
VKACGETALVARSIGMQVNRVLALAGLFATIFVASNAMAQDEEAPAVALRGTLAKIKSSRAVGLGYREASFPFSYLNGANNPIGYSIDLCTAIVEQIGRAVDNPQLHTTFVAVTPETRIQALLAGKIDIECGSSSDTAERRKQVAFSPTIFMAGTKLMVRRGSLFKSINDLEGKTIAAIAASTNAEFVRAAIEKRKLDIKIVTAPDNEQAYGLIADGSAEALASDDILLYGLIARHGAQRDFVVVGDYLSWDPYGLMFRRDDPQFAEVVQTTFAQLAASRDLLEIYHTWFIRRTRTGERLNLPMSPALTEIFRSLGVPE